MQVLNSNEVDEVAGGWVALAGILLAEISAADKLSEFFEGLFEGYGNARNGGNAGTAGTAGNGK